MTYRTYSLLRCALIWAAAGAGWNLSQRIMDYVIDHDFPHVTWLAWLAQ